MDSPCQHPLGSSTTATTATLMLLPILWSSWGENTVRKCWKSGTRRKSETVTSTMMSVGAGDVCVWCVLLGRILWLLFCGDGSSKWQFRLVAVVAIVSKKFSPLRVVNHRTSQRELERGKKEIISCGLLPLFIVLSIYEYVCSPTTTNCIQICKHHLSEHLPAPPQQPELHWCAGGGAECEVCVRPRWMACMHICSGKGWLFILKSCLNFITAEVMLERLEVSKEIHHLIWSFLSTKI